jgi:hypothetical protein
MKNKRRKHKMTRRGRLMKAVGSLISSMEEESDTLRYLSDTLLKHFIKDDASLHDFLSEAGGVRARAMYRALRTMYKPNDPFGKKLIAKLRGTVFSQEIGYRIRKITEGEKKPTGINPNTTAFVKSFNKVSSQGW